MLFTRDLTRLATPAVCAVALSLSACASSAEPLATPEAARVSVPQSIGTSYALVADGEPAARVRGTSGLDDLIAQSTSEPGSLSTPVSLRGAIAFGAPFDCAPGHGSGGDEHADASGTPAAPQKDAAAGGGGGKHDATALAKKSQNPVDDMISLPFEYNANFDQGNRRNTQSVLNIKPVVPMEMGTEWNWIHRLIIPLLDQPEQFEGGYSRSGLGDITYQGFLSPLKPTDGGLIWGVGPTLGMPTATDDILGSGQWTAGPSVVGLHIGKKWVLGGVVSNVWTFAAKDNDRPNVRLLNVQPIVNYNWGKGWYTPFSPVILAKWSAKKSGDVWTVPMGVGIGKVVKIGGQAVDISFRPFYNVHRPDGGARWTAQFVVKFLFPEGD